MNNIERIWENQDWVFSIVLFSFAIIVFTRWFFAKNFAGIFNYRDFIENHDKTFQFAAIYTLLFGLVVSLIIYSLLPKEPVIFSDVPFYSVTAIFVVVIAYLIIKTISDWLLYAIINQTEEFGKLLKNRLFIRIWFVFAWLILSLIIYYSPLPKTYLMYGAIVTILMELILEYYVQYRQFGITILKYSFYIILYLCALDILPLLYITRHWLLI